MKNNKINIIFIYPDKIKKNIQIPINSKIIYEAQKLGVKIIGRCHYTVSCSTCYVEFDENFFNTSIDFNDGNVNEITEEEINVMDNKVLNNKYNGRLCCCLIATKEMNNIHIYITEHSFGLPH